MESLPEKRKRKFDLQKFLNDSNDALVLAVETIQTASKIIEGQNLIISESKKLLKKYGINLEKNKNVKN